MKKKAEPGPTTPFYKCRGKWTFYVFPHGVGEEAGDYPDQENGQGGILEDALHLAGQRLPILTCRSGSGLSCSAW